MNISRFSVNNPVLINILLIIILIFGTLSLSRLPQEQFSEIPFYWVNVIVPYPGVSAEDIEKSVTVKIENAYSNLDKLKKISSVSSQGLSIVRIEFDDGISSSEFASLYQEVKTRFGNIELPDNIANPVIDDFSAADFLPVIEVILHGNTDYKILNENAIILEEMIEAIPDVSGVDVIGGREKQIIIEANKEKLETLGLSISEIVSAVNSTNVSIPGGTIRTENKEYLIRTIGKTDDINEFRDLIIRSGPDSMIRLRDVADVYESYDPEGIDAYYNGNTAVTLRVAKLTGKSSVSVINDVKEAISRFEKPENLQVSLFNDSTIQIKDSINILISNAVIGFVLIIIILFIFIGMRNAVITAFGIPVTFALTFIILELLGETFNTNTLFGLVLVLGLIVDDAIVIVENCSRVEASGLMRKQAAVKGSKQVSLPVIAATLTTVAAFFPLMILPGTIGRFLRVIPLTVTIALLASAFEAVVFLPSHYADWPGKTKIRLKSLFEKIKTFFENILGKLYKFRRLTVFLTVLLIIAGFASVPFLKQDLFSAEDFTLFFIDIELPDGMNTENTRKLVDAFEQRLMPLIGNGEITAVNSYIGFASGSNENSKNSNIAQITVDLTELNEGRTRSITEIMAEIKALCSDIPGAENVNYRKQTNGPPVSPPVSFRLYGDNFNELITVSGEIQNRLDDYPELFDIEDNYTEGTPEIQITVNEERAASLGLNTALIGLSINAYFEGIDAGSVFINNEEINIIVKYSKISLNTLEELEQLKIITPDARSIPFSSVCTYEISGGVSSINREDNKREITIESKAYSEENIRKINSDIKSFFNTELKPLYPDVELKAGGEFADLDNLLFEIGRIFLIGLFLIYLILASQFKSYFQPLLIILSIPFAFAGVIFYLLVSGTPFSTTVLYSGVALAGIAVNDAIVLINFINEKRKNGTSVKEAVISSAVTRLRPIILTSITTIAGLLPTAIGLTGTSVVWGPMASTIIFGLIFSTVSSLVFIPLLYGMTVKAD